MMTRVTATSSIGMSYRAAAVSRQLNEADAVPACVLPVVQHEPVYLQGAHEVDRFRVSAEPKNDADRIFNDRTINLYLQVG